MGIQELVHLNCVEFLCCAVPRSRNSVAHMLWLRSSACLEDDDPVLAHLPNCIMNIVAVEGADTE